MFRVVLSAVAAGLKGGELEKRQGFVDEQCRARLSDSSEPHPGTQQEIRLGSLAGVEEDALSASPW